MSQESPTNLEKIHYAQNGAEFIEKLRLEPELFKRLDMLGNDTNQPTLTWIPEGVNDPIILDEIYELVQKYDDSTSEEGYRIKKRFSVLMEP